MKEIEGREEERPRDNRVGETKREIDRQTEKTGNEREKERGERERERERAREENVEKERERHRERDIER